MRSVSNRTGAKLVDFVAAGAREVRGGLLMPRTYLVTNAYFDADVVINAASFRSHVGIGVSGAMKNMFGCVVGLRRQHIHNLFPGRPAAFGRVIADIYRTIPADLSFLDLTTVAEAAGITQKVCPVGLMLAGTDALALDTVAAHAIGYDDVPAWVSHYGGKFGIGCNVMEKIHMTGLKWENFERVRLRPPLSEPTRKVTFQERATAIVNNTVLRPRPVIDPAACTGCGECALRCPVGAIETSEAVYMVEPPRCADCGCCIKVCDMNAIELKFVGIARRLRLLTNRLPEKLDVAGSDRRLDPAPHL
jgi:ferredoxin